MEIVDFELTQNMSLFLVALSSYVSGVAVMIGIVPYVAVVLIPATVLYCFLMWYYRKAGIDLQRLDAMSRSPIQAMVTEGKKIISVIWKARCSVVPHKACLTAFQRWRVTPPFVYSSPGRFSCEDFMLL
mmetsp:Transcript_2893/g.7400  ORF Transcript_2893/g.7400 Transcript_2893/m.7400 type:complete len:129 (+) Transcript_2893:3075-3461(+)